MTYLSATNLKQLVVKFNRAIDAAGDEDNYVLDTDGTATITAASDFALSEDKMTVTITLTAAADQQEVVDLEIKDILDADETVEGIQFLDVTIPTVVSAEAVGNDTIKVFFSEPMMTGLDAEVNFSVKDADDDTLYVKTATAGTNNMSALVELFADMDGDVTITVDDVEDYQGFATLETALAVPVAIDEAAPTVVSYKDASTTGVTLVFDNDIESAETLADFYHTNATNTADVVTVDGNEVELEFTTSEMPVGTAYVYVAKEAVNDLWDNDNDKITVMVTITTDEVVPTVEGDVDVKSQDTIEVTYSEDVVEGDDFEVTLLDEDGDDTEISSTATFTDDVLELVFAEDIYGDYTVVIEDVEDAAGNEAADASLAFNVADETDPVATDFVATVYNAGLATQLVVIDFKEEMDAASVTTKGLYFYGTKSFDDSDVTITVTNDGKSVEIEAPAADVVTMAATNDVTIGRVTDAAGNLLSTLSGALTLVDGDATEVLVDTVEVTAVDTVVLTVKDDELTTLDITKFSFEDDSNNVLDIAKVKTGLNGDGETTITFTLGTDLKTDATTDGTDAVNVIVAAGAGENKYGQDLETILDGADEELTDKVAPALADNANDDPDVEASIVAGDDTITLTFTEDINPSTVSLVTFDVEDQDVTAVDVTNNVITLTLEADADGETPVGLKVTQAATIKDAAAVGNAVTGISEDSLDTVIAAPLDNAVTGFDLVAGAVDADTDDDTVDIVVGSTASGLAEDIRNEYKVDVAGATLVAATVADGSATVAIDAAANLVVVNEIVLETVATDNVWVRAVDASGNKSAWVNLGADL